MSSTISREVSPSPPSAETPAAGEKSDLKAPARPRSAGKKAWTRTMVWIRRIHLYSGLFMFPWVLLYGFTGMFFNHPQAFNGAEVTSFSGAAVADGKLKQLASPRDLAREVVDAINQARRQAAEVDRDDASAEVRNTATPAPGVVLTDIRAPEFNRFFQFDVEAEDRSVRVIVDPLSGDGEVHVSASSGEERGRRESHDAGPLADVRRVELPSNSLAAVQQAVPAVLKELDLPTGEAATGRLTPSLLFSAEVDGEPCVISYNLGNGFLSAASEGQPAEMDAKSFLQRLHLSRGYSPHWGVRTLWAISVDAMFASMVFWGLSGIVMWWQIKRTRLLGAGVILASLACATLLVVGMHDSLTVAGRRGPGGARGGPGGQRGGRGELQVEREGDSPGEASEGRFRGRGGRGRRGGGSGGSGRGGFDRDGFGRGFGRPDEHSGEASADETNKDGGMSDAELDQLMREFEAYSRNSERTSAESESSGMD